MEDLEAMRMKAIRDAQARTRMELMASNPPPRPPQPSERERDEAHRLLAEQMVQRSLSMQVEALRRREVMKHQMILQRQVENERAKMEEEEEATVAGGITNGAIADAAVVETGQSDDTVRGDATEYSYSIASPRLPTLTRSPQPTHHSPLTNVHLHSLCTQLYENYVPAKVKEGNTHPDHVVETSTLSQLQPPGMFIFTFSSTVWAILLMTSCFV